MLGNQNLRGASLSLHAVPSSPEASRRPSRVHQNGTLAEPDLRRALHTKRLRYHLHQPLLTKPRPVTDIFYHKAQVAIFVGGCFWHGCPRRASWPKSNSDIWSDKIEANRSKDADADQRLKALAWQVVRIWEHEYAGDSANLIAQLIHARRKNGAGPCR